MLDDGVLGTVPAVDAPVLLFAKGVHVIDLTQCVLGAEMCSSLYLMGGLFLGALLSEDVLVVVLLSWTYRSVVAFLLGLPIAVWCTLVPRCKSPMPSLSEGSVVVFSTNLRMPLMV